jgi:hypothetical protein
MACKKRGYPTQADALRDVDMLNARPGQAKLHA